MHLIPLRAGHARKIITLKARSKLTQSLNVMKVLTIEKEAPPPPNCFLAAFGRIFPQPLANMCHGCGDTARKQLHSTEMETNTPGEVLRGDRGDRESEVFDHQ